MVWSVRAGRFAADVEIGYFAETGERWFGKFAGDKDSRAHAEANLAQNDSCLHRRQIPRARRRGTGRDKPCPLYKVAS